MACYATGIGNLGWHGSEAFPLELRGLGSALLTASCWSINVVVSSTFLSILKSIGAAGAFGLYAGFSFVSDLVSLDSRHIPDLSMRF